MIRARKTFSMPSKEDDEKARNTKRRRSAALPDTVNDLPETKKIRKIEEEIKLDVKLEMETSVSSPAVAPVIAPISDVERRKRLREILHIILTKLKKKDVYNILHQRPCSLMYPNYNMVAHIDMSMVAERVTKMCYYNIAQFRQAIQRVCNCQTTFFPANTVRHQFSIKFDLYARKQTTYRALVTLCDQLEIPDEMPRKQLRNMIVGTDLTTETPINKLLDNKEEDQTNSKKSAASEQTNDTSTCIKREASLAIVSGAPSDAFVNGKAVTIADVAGRIIGAYDLPKKTRTIEDKAYTISYLSYGNYSAFAPSYDSRAATVSKDDSELLFSNKRDDNWNELEKIANLDEVIITEYLAKSRLGVLNAADTLTEELPTYEPNPTELATLSDLGVDISFLDAFSPNAKAPEDQSLPALIKRLSEILPKLLAKQNQRLLSKTHRDVIDHEELRTAEQIQIMLAKALKLTAPGAACSVSAVRKAMGVNI